MAHSNLTPPDPKNIIPNVSTAKIKRVLRKRTKREVCEFFGIARPTLDKILNDGHQPRPLLRAYINKRIDKLIRDVGA